MKIKLSLLAFISITFFLYAQEPQLTTDAEISIITVGPGFSLNDAFGHNAFRVKDRNLGYDLVYNYGVYDFNAPNFYTKFAQGKLNYKMGLNYFDDFFSAYSAQNRTIKEQILNLSQVEKQQLFNYLLENYKPENRYYLYDFFFDNCATKIRDVVEDALNNDVEFRTPEDFKAKSFRALIHDHVDRNSWGAFGIDLALGSVIDKEATPYEHMYLPKYIHLFFSEAERNNSNPLMKGSKVLYAKIENEEKSSLYVSPLFIIGILSFILVLLTYFDYKNRRRTKWLDIIVFAFTGLIGVIILLLWFATDHTATAYNYNLLWAFPLNLLVLGQLFKNNPKKWFAKYLKFLVIILCLLALHWLIGVQVYAIGLIPFLIALLIRYIYLVIFYTASENTI